MKIRLRNCDPGQREEIRAALDFYIRRLLGDRMSRNIEIDVTFVEGLRRRERRKGDVIYRGNLSQKRYRKFHIRIDRNMGLRAKLLIMAHESAHIKQFVRNELRDYRADRVTWHGQCIREDAINYWERPWEIEARGWETGLYVLWRQHRKTALDKD